MPSTEASMVLIAPPTGSRGTATAVIEECRHVPAFAFGERGESGFPGHGKVRLEAVAHPLELHVVPGHQVEDVESLLEAGQALDLAREQALRPAGLGDHGPGYADEIEFALIERLDHGRRRAETTNDHDRYARRVGHFLGEVHEIGLASGKALAT